MIRSGFTFEHPSTKTRTVVLEAEAETNGMGWLLELTRYSAAGSDLGEHSLVEGRPLGRDRRDLGRPPRHRSGRSQRCVPVDRR